jgi:pimeloyl-ACP methyl ester carboxylesterase
LGDLTPRLPEIRPQTLVIWGEKDLTLNPKSFPRLARRLPNAVGIPVAGSKHQPHIARPLLVNRLVLDFLAGKEFGR